MLSLPCTYTQEKVQIKGGRSKEKFKEEIQGLTAVIRSWAQPVKHTDQSCFTHKQSFSTIFYLSSILFLLLPFPPAHLQQSSVFSSASQSRAPWFLSYKVHVDRTENSACSFIAHQLARPGVWSLCLVLEVLNQITLL